MNCSELREIMDSYLGEDAVPTRNNEVLEHLKLCTDCSLEIADQRNLRAMLRTAVLKVPAWQMSDEFGARLRTSLRITMAFWP